MRTSSNLGAIAACTLWASAFAGVKFGLGFLPMFTFAGLRFLLAGAMQIPFVRPVSDLPRLAARPHTWLVSLCNTFLLYTAFFYGMTLVRGAQAAIVIGASPLVAAWMAHWFMPDDPMNPRKHVAFTLGIVGVAVIALGSKPWEPVGRAEVLGMGVLLSASLISSVGNILVARGPAGTRAVSLNSVQMLLGGAGLLGVGFAVEGPQDLGQLPPAFWGTLVYLAFLSAAAFAIWFVLLQREKVSEVNLWKFLVPVLGAVFSWVLLSDESPDLISVMGMLLVSAGIYAGNRRA